MAAKDSERQPVLDAAALNAFLGRAFPDRPADGASRVDMVGPGVARIILDPVAANLRPGGIVSGPTLMAMADTAAYVLILAHIGEVAMAVTSSLTYHFLAPCPAVRVVADARFIKLGRRQALVDVRLTSVASPQLLVGQSLVTYALPAAAKADSGKAVSSATNNG